jgi:hypothetical protein
MKKLITGFDHTQEQQGGILGLDMASLELPLTPEVVTEIARRRRNAQLELRKRIDEGVVKDG